MSRFRTKVVSLGVLLFAFQSFPAEQATYTITDLGGLQETRDANATAINDAGQIVGTSAGHAFLWEAAVMTDLGTLGGPVSAAHAVNASGQIVGEYETARGEVHAFLWQRGVMTDLGLPGESSSARGINDRGEIIGFAGGKNLRGGAILWKDGARQPLGDLGPSGSGSNAMAINDKGEIAGVSSGFAARLGGVVRAVIWLRGAIQDIGTLGGPHSTARAINDSAEVVGWADLPDQSTVAFLWKDGLLQDLGTLPGAVSKPGIRSQALSINHQGLVVGSALNSKGEIRAVIWENGGAVDLNTLIPSNSGVVLTRATAINNKGQIVAQEQLRADGPVRSFLLTPRFRRDLQTDRHREVTREVQQ